MTTQVRASAGVEDDTSSGSRYSESSDENPESQAASEDLNAQPDDGNGGNEGNEDSEDEDDTGLDDEVSEDGFIRDPRMWKRGPSFSEKELKSRLKKKRLRGRYRPKYRDLYNSVIESAIDPTIDNSGLLLEPSDIGVSQWTSDEKALLFSRLAAWGRGNCHKLSEWVGTKSETEVRDYLDHLLQGSVEDYLTSTRYFGIGLDEIPSAFEVPPECEAELDFAAEALCQRVENSDKKREKSRHGKYWLLDGAVAAEVEGAPEEPGPKVQVPDPSGEANIVAEVQSTQQSPVEAASLLHLGNWLELASLFMSSSADYQSSWVDIIESNDERPSIFYTAFSDFHTLAIILTKRIIQASIFQAMSRLRASDRNEPEHIVRHQDVQTACRIMGLGDWKDFWTGLPRRRRLEVFTRGKYAGPDKRTNKAKILNYDQVEAFLQSTSMDEAALDEFEEGKDAAMESVEGGSSDSGLFYDSDFWTDAPTSEHGQDATQQQSAPLNVNREASEPEKVEVDSNASSTDVPPYDRDKAETAYLEALDLQASRQEASRLWAILKSKPPEDGPKDEEVNLPAPPPRKRKKMEEIEDWRDKVEYRPEWQEFETVPGPEHFAAMGKIGRDAKKTRLEKQSSHIS
ncbi:putative DNA binding protein 13 [Elsinoe australis]|uniref:Putative DNA binding protein 13 n=1 Tax=Elsinoe australis TaxID=40998 RepID=A0A4U7AZE7_9PEZI|nr:putative DNA binding protein 13 [Elsinoe australis]